MRRLNDTAIVEIEKRHWGTRAPGRLANGVRRGSRALRPYILDVRGLFLATGLARYLLLRHGCGLLYRGQPVAWPLQCALFRGARLKTETTSRLAWLERALKVAAEHFDPEGTDDEREALVQHYGLPTRWLDLVDHVQTAAWFAYHVGSESAAQRDDAVGYFYAVARPGGAAEAAGSVIDLRRKPSEWLRPHVQQAWALKAADPSRNLGSLTDFVVAEFIVPRPLLRSWAAYDSLPPSVMFPNVEEDSGLRYWRNAERALMDGGLLPIDWSRPPNKGLGVSGYAVRSSPEALGEVDRWRQERQEGADDAEDYLPLQRDADHMSRISIRGLR